MQCFTLKQFSSKLGIVSSKLGIDRVGDLVYNVNTVGVSDQTRWERVKMTSYAFELMQSGYCPGGFTAEIEFGDAEIAEQMRCPKCGGTMHFEAFHTPTSYVALAVCNICDYEQEF